MVESGGEERAGIVHSPLVLYSSFLNKTLGNKSAWEEIRSMGLRHQISLVCVLTLPLMGSVTLDKLFILSGLRVLTYKINIIKVPTIFSGR